MLSGSPGRCSVGGQGGALLYYGSGILEAQVVQAEGRTFSFEGVEAITPDILEVFSYEYRAREGGDEGLDRKAVIEISTDEYTVVCPFSGLPDFGSLIVRYTPGDVCIELKSLKYYIYSYRNVGIYQEHAANRILEDLAACCSPQWMELVLDYRLRGGIHTVVTVSTGKH